jgi:hypothetical protein
MGASGSISGLSHEETLTIEEARNLQKFIARRDAFVLDKACGGFGTNDALLISLLTSRTKRQLGYLNAECLIQRKGCSSRKLEERIESECGGNYGDFLKYLAEPTGLFLYRQLKEATGGIGCDKSLLNETLCLSTTKDISLMKEKYQSYEGGSITDKLRGELSGEHEELILYLLTKGRSDTLHIDQKQATKVASQLHEIFKNGSGMFGFKDDAKVEVGKLLCQHSPTQMKAISGG